MSYIDIDSYNVNYKDVKTTVEALKNGSIVVFPTDSVLALGCLLDNKKGVKRIIKLTEKEEKKSNLSLFFTDLKNVAKYSLNYSNSTYRAVNRLVPGPYTFIFNANKEVTKFFENKKKEVGVRIPSNEFLRAVLKELDTPIISTSLNGDKFDKFNSNVLELSESFKNEIDLFVNMEDSEKGETTVLDCTGEDIVLVRQGIGQV